MTKIPSDYDLEMMVMGATPSEVPGCWEALVYSDESLKGRWEQARLRVRKREQRLALIQKIPGLSKMMVALKQFLVSGGKGLKFDLERPSRSPLRATLSQEYKDLEVLEIEGQATSIVKLAVGELVRLSLSSDVEDSPKITQLDRAGERHDVSSSVEREEGRYYLDWLLEEGEAPVILEISHDVESSPQCAIVVLYERE